MSSDKRRPSKQGRRPSAGQQSNGMGFMRSKAAIGTIAGTIVVGFVAALAAFTRPNDPEPEPSVTPTVSVSPTPQLSTEETRALRAPLSCAEQPKTGTVVVGFDDTNAVSLLEGEADLSEIARNTNETGISVDIGQRPEDVTLEAAFDAPIDAEGKVLRLWINQNGNLLPRPDALWRARLHSGPESYFERIFSQSTAAAAVQWCQDESRLRGWTPHGDPDATALTSLQIVVPGWPGAGAGNRASFDEFSLS